MNKDEVWLCADQDGEKMFKGQKPVRYVTTLLIPQEIELWTAKGQDGVDYEMISLPKGMIERIIGTNLTWENEPIKYEVSSAVIRTADKIKTYEQIKSGFSKSWDDQEVFLKNLMDESVMKPSRILEIISSHIKYQDDLLETGGFIKEERISYLIEFGKPYACLNKEGKLCKVIAGTDKWKEVVYVLPKMKMNALNDILISLNPDGIGKYLC